MMTDASPPPASSANPTIYLDYNATTPLAPEVHSEVVDCLTERWQNPSSGYESGRKAKKVVDRAREQVREMINGDKRNGKVIFTSGGTESNHLALYSALESSRPFRKKSINFIPHFITTDIEHVAVELPLNDWKDKGEIELTVVPVSRSTGIVSASDILDAVKDNTVMISVMMANNETGVIQPIKEIGSQLETLNPARSLQSLPRVLFHTDGAQAIGKIEVNVRRLKVDYFTIVGHKYYGPRNGALYCSPSAPVHAFLLGGGQESAYRAGTENTPMIAGLGVASQLASRYQCDDHDEMSKLRDRLLEGLQSEIGADCVKDNFGHVKERLPNTLSASFKNVYGAELIKACKGALEASTTSACHTDTSPTSTPKRTKQTPRAPKVLLRSGVSEEAALGTVRLSVGRCTTAGEVEKAVKVLTEAYKGLVAKME